MRTTWYCLDWWIQLRARSDSLVGRIWPLGHQLMTAVIDSNSIIVTVYFTSFLIFCLLCNIVWTLLHSCTRTYAVVVHTVILTTLSVYLCMLNGWVVGSDVKLGTWLSPDCQDPFIEGFWWHFNFKSQNTLFLLLSKKKPCRCCGERFSSCRDEVMKRPCENTFLKLPLKPWTPVQDSKTPAGVAVMWLPGCQCIDSF